MASCSNSTAPATVKLYRGQQRTFTLRFWQPDKLGRIDLTGKNVTIEDNTLPIVPVLTVLDAEDGEVKLQLSAGDNDPRMTYSFRIRVGEGEENELDWPPIEVTVR